MRTPSDLTADAASATRAGEWTARRTSPNRSVFGNYHAGTTSEVEALAESAATRQSPCPTANDPAATGRAIDLAMARAFLHRFLAKAYESPSPEGWDWLCADTTRQGLRSACTFALPEGSPLAFPPDGFGAFLDAYLAAFGHAARGACPLNEIEYGDLKADPLFQPHRLADLAAFYRAFGLELTADAGERQDHLCLELEFMCVLSAKETYALEHQMDADRFELCREAQKTFLREHLGRWTPAFTRRLAATTSDPVLRGLAAFTRAFVEAECERFGVRPGSEDLALRPVDETASHACDSCGIQNLPPGAMATA